MTVVEQWARDMRSQAWCVVCQLPPVAASASCWHSRPSHAASEARRSPERAQPHVPAASLDQLAGRPQQPSLARGGLQRTRRVAACGAAPASLAPRTCPPSATPHRLKRLTSRDRWSRGLWHLRCRVDDIRPRRVVYATSGIEWQRSGRQRSGQCSAAAPHAHATATTRIARGEGQTPRARREPRGAPALPPPCPPALPHPWPLAPPCARGGRLRRL